MHGLTFMLMYNKIRKKISSRRLSTDDLCIGVLILRVRFWLCVEVKVKI